MNHSGGVVNGEWRYNGLIDQLRRELDWRFNGFCDLHLVMAKPMKCCAWSPTFIVFRHRKLFPLHPEGFGFNVWSS